jgi:uncharacterized protein YwgA
MKEPRLNHLDVDDLVLLVVHANGEKLTGRTKLQKVIYFLSEMLRIPAGYRAHFYGPYSATVAETVDAQVSRGVLAEQRDDLGGWDAWGHDYKLYTYHLTDKGREAYAWRRSQAPAAFDEAERWARRILDSGADYMLLSYAAKLWLMVQQQDGVQPVRVEDLQAHARDLGWHIDEADIQRGVQLLDSLFLKEPDQT